MFPFEYAFPTKEAETVTSSGLIDTETSDGISESEQINQNLDILSYVTQIHQNMVLSNLTIF